MPGLEAVEIPDRGDKMKGRRAYALTAERMPFAFLEATDDGAALMWDGQINFAYIEREFFNAGTLSRLFHEPGLVSAAFIMTSNDVVRIDFEESGAELLYRDITSNKWDDIAYARFDLAEYTEDGDVSQLSKLAIAADNPEAIERGSPSITIRLPNHSRWSDALAEWILGHHRLNEKMAAVAVAAEQVATMLNSLTRGQELTA